MEVRGVRTIECAAFDVTARGGPISKSADRRDRAYVAPRLVPHGDLRGLTLGGSQGLQESPGFCIPGDTECSF